MPLPSILHPDFWQRSCDCRGCASGFTVDVDDVYASQGAYSVLCPRCRQPCYLALSKDEETMLANLGLLRARLGSNDIPY